MRDDRTTETEEAAIAAEAIQGWSTKPTGMNTPADNREGTLNTQHSTLFTLSVLKQSGAQEHFPFCPQGGAKGNMLKILRQLLKRDLRF